MIASPDNNGRSLIMVMVPCCIRAACFGIAALFWVSAALAAASNPLLFAEVNGIDDTSRKRVLRLSSLAIDIRIEGSVAETTLTAKFAGVDGDVVEGHFSLSLPEGAVVTGYALDIDDQLVEGSLVAPPKARAVYESKVRKAIDPGIAEVSSSNVFSTKVFPIRDDVGRTIRVRFVAPVHRGLSLPLATDESIANVAINITAHDVESAPQIELPAGLAPTWQRTRNEYTVAVSERDVRLQGTLSVAPTTPRRSALLSMSEGQRFFQIRDSQSSGEHAGTRPNRIRVYWDASLSRRDDALAQEIDLLERYMRFALGAPVDLVIFNSTTAKVMTIDSVEHLRSTLGGVTYRGGTSYAVIDAMRLADAEVCLLFSDGAATIDRRDTFKPDCTLKAIASAPDAERSYLAQLTRDSGGVVIRLGIESVDKAYDRLLQNVPVIAGAASVEGRPLSFTVVENDGDGWFVVGEAPRAGDIILRFKRRSGRIVEHRYASSARSTRFDGVAALWASDQIAALTVAEADMNEIERLSRRYCVASPLLAFVVLETAQDYADADVVPPKTFPQHALEEYVLLRREHEADLLADRAYHLESLHEAWEEHKDWWSTDFDPRAKPQRRSVLGAPYRQQSSGRMTGGGGFGGGGGVGLDEIIVTGSFIPSTPEDAVLAIAPFESDRPYIRALNDSSQSNLDALLAAQEKDHGQLPSFYLDTAEWLFRRNQVTEASEMLLSALELPLSNDETKAIVGDRLLRYGYVDRAIWVYEQVERSASHRPQPKLQLAVALAKRASLRAQSAKRDLQRAISLLNDVAITRWDGEYEGVALSALMEANSLIPKYLKLGGTRVALAPELIALLDLDIRVVIQWNTAATDLDLWVDEPNGDRAIFSNRLTAIGGLLSEDMQEGYGPEEYALRRAASGEYRVHIDVYATDSINPNGATTVTARLIHDFGRPTQHEESVDIELLPDAQGERFVGSIRIGGTE
jgi:tetratricopeptide (TPR) repeat protein